MQLRLLDENIGKFHSHGNVIQKFLTPELEMGPLASGGTFRQPQLQCECDLSGKGLRVGQRLWEAALFAFGEGAVVT